MSFFFSRKVAEAAVAPTPLGDKMGPPEAGFEEAETVAQPIGARHGLSPRALPRTRPRPAPAFSMKHGSDILIARVPCISTSRPLACGSFRGSPTTPCWPRLVPRCATAAAHMTTVPCV